jgi:hypothetical protein
MSDPSETTLRSVADRFADIALMIHEIEKTLLGISQQELINDRKRRLALECLKSSA